MLPKIWATVNRAAYSLQGTFVQIRKGVLHKDAQDGEASGWPLYEKTKALLPSGKMQPLARTSGLLRGAGDRFLPPLIPSGRASYKVALTVADP